MIHFDPFQTPQLIHSYLWIKIIRISTLFAIILRFCTNHQNMNCAMAFPSAHSLFHYRTSHCFQLGIQTKYMNSCVRYKNKNVRIWSKKRAQHSTWNKWLYQYRIESSLSSHVFASPLISNHKYKHLSKKLNFNRFELYATKISNNINNFADEQNSQNSQIQISSSESTIEKWKKSNKEGRHLMLDETKKVPSILVPTEHIQQVLKPDSVLRPYLAFDMFEGIHPRVKMVRDFVRHEYNNEDLSDIEDSDIKKKLVLLHPKCIEPQVNTNQENHHKMYANLDSFSDSFPGIPISSVLDKNPNLLTILPHFQPGPLIPVKIPYDHLPISTILQKLLPAHAHPPPVSFEIIGTVAHFNLKPVHVPYGSLIGEVILERFSPQIQTVVNKIGEVGGPFRTYEMDILATNGNLKANNDQQTKHHMSSHNEHNPFWVTLVENSVSLEFDVRKVYWCTRLSGERQKLLTDEFKPNQIIADAFCGVGALCIHAIKKMNCTVIANDLNPDAVHYALNNAKLNGIDKGNMANGRTKQMDVTCGDARDFIRKLGRREEGLPDHLIMNFPLASPQFLDALRWWPSRKGPIRQGQIQNSKKKRKKKEYNNHDDLVINTMVHLYTFSKSTSEDERDVIDVAIDLVAEGLLVEAGDPGEAKIFLNDMLGCNIRAREVRDVAPGKAVICVSFQITDKLLRHMQGDFIDI